MAEAKKSVTYSEDLDILRWIDGIRDGVSKHRDGANVSRGDVIRWLTRRARRQVLSTPLDVFAGEI